MKLKKMNAFDSKQRIIFLFMI